MTSGVKSSFVYPGGQLLFRINGGSTTAHFYATDPSNNVRLVWSYASGNVSVELEQRSKPFGGLATSLATPALNLHTLCRMGLYSNRSLDCLGSLPVKTPFRRYSAHADANPREAGSRSCRHRSADR